MDTASGNNFSGFSNQCTWWSAQRYHTLTGVWVPMLGNAYEWNGEATQHGWMVANAPPKGLPSIICLQGNAGQGVDATYGHVAIVERINADGSVYTSDFNWYPHVGDSVVSYVTFRTGQGVSFIWAGNGVGKQDPITATVTAVTQVLKNATTTYSLSSNAGVAVALATLDALTTVTPPFDVQPQHDNIIGVDIVDPVSWFTGVGFNIINDTRALTLRVIMICVGIYMLFRVVAHFIDFSGVINSVQSSAQTLAPLFME